MTTFKSKHSSYTYNIAPELERKRMKFVEIVSKPDFLELWEPEFFDIVQPLIFGKNKHGKSNWLEPNGSKCSKTEMHDSMFHHLSKSYSGERLDKEMQLNHKLALAVRAVMAYTRESRGLIHDKDR